MVDIGGDQAFVTEGNPYLFRLPFLFVLVSLDRNGGFLSLKVLTTLLPILK